MSSAAQRAADRAFQRGMTRWLQELKESERLSTSVHNRIADQVGSRLRDAHSSEVNRIIRATFRDFEADRIGIIERAITNASRRGVGMTEPVARAIFDARARRAIAPVLDDPEALRRRIASQRMNGDLTIDRLSVRERLRNRTRVVADRMAERVQSSLRLGETTTQTSERLLRASDIRVRIPRYIQDIRDAAGAAQPGVLRARVNRQLSALQDGRIQEHNIAGETRRFLQQVRRSKGADIDSAVEQWVRGRAANQAMTIARTEGQSALAQAYVESTREQPWVVGYRFNLSPSHETPDCCDILAAQDLYGLGAGGYPTEDVPSLGHPNCLCFITAIIDDRYLERERARADGDEEPPRSWETDERVTARDWLRSIAPERREAILGAGRAAEFQRRPGRVVNDDGSLNPLWSIQGRRPPAPPEGERFIHRASGRVESLTEPPRRARS